MKSRNRVVQRLCRLAEAFAHVDVISGLYCIQPDNHDLFSGYAAAGIAELETMLRSDAEETRRDSP